MRSHVGTPCLVALTLSACMGEVTMLDPKPPADAALVAFLAPDAGQVAEAGAVADAIVTALALTEECDNGLDDDHDGKVDEDCPCAAGATQLCYTGAPTLAGRGACAYGQQPCVVAGRGEFNRWGDCQGSGAPQKETCDGVDNDCNGLVDDGLVRSCSTKCASGHEVCAAGVWGACDAPVPEPTSVQLSPWEMNLGEGVVFFGSCSSAFDPGGFKLSSIPAANDPGWGPAPSASTIGYVVPSTLCGVAGCHCGADFTYFRTFVSVPADVTLTSLTVSALAVDDSFQTTIFNSAHPQGATASELAPLVVSGETNTVVVTHDDDCCSQSHISASVSSAATRCVAATGTSGG